VTRPQPDPVPPTAQDFDRALGEVEKIIERIESGQIGLEQSITEYERGARLLRQCRDRLVKAEQRVKDLTEQLRAEAASAPAPAADERDPAGNGDKDVPF
jgi:exodeoxyribonuclease VII small subunit